MESRPATRRDFLSASAGALGAGWLWMHLPLASVLAACARESAARGEGFQTFTDAQARTMSAVATQIVPADAELPGAEEAGAIYFVDRALAGPFAAMRDPVLAGLGDLDTRARTRSAALGGFADLESAVQTEVLREVEDTQFFFFARMLTIMGVVADPSYGGNRDGAGARLMAIEHRPAFAPPFGYYDAEVRRTAAGGA